MTTLFLNKSVKIFLSAVLIGISAYVAWACIDMEWPEGYNSNYTPESFVPNKAEHPFFFSYLYYYGIGTDTEHDTRFNDSNVKEWQSYLNGAMTAKEISYWLYKASPADIAALSQQSTSSPKSPLSSKARANLSVWGKGDPIKTAAFATYLPIAKRCEDFAVSGREDWEYSPARGSSETAADPKIAAQLQNEMTQAKDAFMRQRYWFQLVRYYYYFSPAKAITLFEQQRAPFEANQLFYRTMAYCAGAYYRQKNYAQANYYYSLVFAAGDKLKTVAHFSFHPQEESDWNKTLQLARNNSEKATLWQLLGIHYADEARSIQAIYGLDPKSPRTDLLLTRLVNKIERTDIYEYFPELDDDSSDEPYDPKVSAEREKKRAALSAAKRSRQLNADLAWISPIADKGNTASPFLWHISAGYLHFLNNNYEKANFYYRKAEQVGSTASKLGKKQLRLLNLLNNIAQAKTISATQENASLADLTWLYDQQDIDSTDQFRCAEAKQWIAKTLADRYQAQKDYAKAECWHHNIDLYTQPEKLKTYKAFLSQKTHSPYEQLCVKRAEIALDDIWELEAVLDAFAEKLPDAIDKMQKGGDGAKTELLGNPFNGKIKDCHDCDHAAAQSTTYNKVSFLQKMLEMRQKIDRNEDVYNNALLLGNAYYNMTHHGNARVFYENKVIGYGHYQPNIIAKPFRSLLTNCNTAEKYYRQALQNATDNEQRAKCHYLIAKCQRNEWYNQNVFTDDYNEYAYNPDEEVIDFIEWDGFKELKKLSDTKYYRNVLNECGYFAKTVEK